MNDPISQALAAAITLHQSGNLAEAQLRYQGILAEQPNHADALHYLGLLAHQSGQIDAALQYLSAAAKHHASNPDIAVNLANLLKDCGQLEAAERAYLHALTLQPDMVIARHNLGHLYQLWGHWRDAQLQFEQLLDQQPDFALAWDKLGLVLRQQGDLSSARASHERAMAIQPDNAVFCFHLADCYILAEDWSSARQMLERALSWQPLFAEAQNNLGLVLDKLGLRGQAQQALLAAIACNPVYPDPCMHLGRLLLEEGRIEASEHWYGRALQIAPQHPPAHLAMGIYLAQTGRVQQAVNCYQQALALQPDWPEALNSLGIAYQMLYRFDESSEAFQRAILVQPDFFDAYANLGNLQRLDHCPDLAEASLREALLLRPDFAAVHSNLGNVYFDQGKIDEAIASYARGIALGQTDQAFMANYLFALNYSTELDGAAIGDIHRDMARRFYDVLSLTAPSHQNQVDLQRRLRIGYVSPDFWMHPVARFLLPILRHHDRVQFELFAYSTQRIKDGMTLALAEQFDHWREVQGMDDDQLAQGIREDRIDILVDLALHTHDGRAGLFARRPAPIQLSYLAYAGTSGLAAMDYRLTDVYLDPPDQPAAGFVEKPLHLPFCWWSLYHPEAGVDNFPSINSTMPTDAQLMGFFGNHQSPVVSPLPCLRRGTITFACLNSLSKFNHATQVLWLRILNLVADSRLVLHIKNARNRRKVLNFFVAQGIAAERLQFQEYLNGREYLSSYHDIDIVLDTFPFNGGTTTFDALWMGVPVVTLAGERPVSRGGLSILTTLGYPEWVAHTPDDYVAIAGQLAGDRVRLAEIRAGLRDAIQASPLVEGARLTREIERHYRAIWQTWCKAASGFS